MASCGFDDDQTRSFTNLATGTVVSHYKINSKIGAGGMGEVYLAEDTRLDRKVALKFLFPHLSQDEPARARFTREAKAAAKLDHPNIVQVFEVGEFQGRPFFAMAHIEGKSLKEVIREGELSINEAIEFTKQICAGMHKAHESGVVHRDIKPGNIIIDADNKARICDFGLATVAGEEKLTKTGSTLGTVGYMSPEQIECKKVDHRSDLFSVGIILYEMLTGRRPFAGDTDAAVARSITDASPEPIARYKSGTTGELQQIVDKALSKDPSLRYQHADGMLADLRRLHFETASTAKNKLGLWVAAAVIVILGGYLGYTQFLKEQPQSVGPKRLVVLPFESLGGEDEEYFASGVTDEVISRLSSINGLSVVSRMSAARMKQAGEDIKSIGRELGVEYVLDASARYQLGSDGSRRVRLTTQLINVTEDEVVWSQTYDTIMTEVFAVQANIAEQVAERMDIVLLEADREQVWERWTESEEAWDLYQRGRAQVERYSWSQPEGWRLAIEFYRKAIAIDSNLAPAYMHMSVSYGRLYAHRFVRTDTTKSMCLWAAEKAMQLTDHPFVKYWAMGRYHALCTKDWEKTLQYYDLAYEGDTNSTGYLNYGHHVLFRTGRVEQAYEWMKRLVELEPRSVDHKYDLAMDCMMLKRYTAAFPLLEECVRLRPDWSWGYGAQAENYLRWKGDTDKALALIHSGSNFIDDQSDEWAEFLTLLNIAAGDVESARKIVTSNVSDSLLFHELLARCSWVEGDTSAARASAESMLRLAQVAVAGDPNDGVFHSKLALANAFLGNNEVAIRIGKRACELLPFTKDYAWAEAPAWTLFEVFVFTGNIEEAIHQLDVLRSKDVTTDLGLIFCYPYYRPVLEHKQFRDIMENYADTAQWRVYREKVGGI